MRVVIMSTAILYFVITTAYATESGNHLLSPQPIVLDGKDSLDIRGVSEDGRFLTHVAKSSLFLRDLSTNTETLIWKGIKGDFTLSPDNKILFENDLFRSVPDGRELSRIGTSTEFITFDHTGKVAIVKGPVEVALVSVDKGTRVRLLKIPKAKKPDKKHSITENPSPQDYVTACSLDAGSVLTVHYLPQRKIEWRVHSTRDGIITKSGSILTPKDWSNAPYSNVDVSLINGHSDKVIISFHKLRHDAEFFLDLSRDQVTLLGEVSSGEASSMRMEIAPVDVRSEFTVFSQDTNLIVTVNNATKSLSLVNLSKKRGDWTLDEQTDPDANPLNDLWIHDVLFSPNGNRIFVSTSSDSHQEIENEQLLVMSVDSGKVEKTFTIKAGKLRFSPDGKDLIIWRKNGAWRVPLVGIL